MQPQNFYQYLDPAREKVLFSCHAPTILDADRMAGPVAMKSACRIGLRLVFLFDVRGSKLWGEDVVHVPADGEKREKFYLNLPGWFHRNDELVTNIGDSKLHLIRENMELVKKYMYNPSVRKFWRLPNNRVQWAKDDLEIGLNFWGLVEKVENPKTPEDAREEARKAAIAAQALIEQ